ncbi:uncharacterized protein PHACADRAFT_213216 [Phanerochaete carnosa HHB-10118-sp]|uniref:Uncharacterized protein n=1 Tax=Phanerochaete carnosa (strain HHB-10118-sp) TaxID=650164 RepID=K5VJ97_PHACS|nr:uncharacterized protein PHACADRAFT_213216 [Phanerochaete carnosa HHB-10118-sp]EKM51383.1 hypothetical protein PHACADRAFT_213216 [Phanerochaete carnosa HHB-10118-sp]
MSVYDSDAYESIPDAQQQKAMEILWNAPYTGQDDEILADAILEMKTQANGTAYTNILPIVQSSGMGKSGLTHEVTKFFVTIPLNIRSAADRIAAKKHGLQSVLDMIVHFAFAKLVCYSPLDEYLKGTPKGGYTLAMRFAPLCLRLLLNFNRALSGTHALTEEMVAQRMRIAYCMPTHNESIKSGTSSELLLAEAAAWAMDACTGIDWLADLTRTFDCAGAPYRTSSAATMQCLYSAAVPVLDFLRALFAKQWYDAKLGTGMSSMWDVLDAHAALAAVARGHAMMLSPAHDAVHIAILVVMEDTKLGTGAMLYIFIQLKMRYGPACRLDEADVEAVFRDEENAHPFIHLVMQLEPGIHPPTGGSPVPDEAEEVEEEMGETGEVGEDVEEEAGKGRSPLIHPCYRLTGYGCSPAVYKVVEEKDQEHYATLLKPEAITSDHPCQKPINISFLQRMKGEWERTSACYDWAAVATLQSPGEMRDSVEGVFAV